MRYLWLLIFTYCTWAVVAQAPADSAVMLPATIVQGDRYSLLPAGARYDSLQIDALSVQMTDGLDDVLADEGLMFLRQYGPVGLASISVRGTSASQSAVLWNGMNLQSPMNGQKDLRLMPAFFLESASVSYGVGSAIAGSGAIGSTLELSSRPEELKGRSMRMQTALGSYGYATYGMALEYGGEKFRSSTKLYLNRSDNHYPFTNTTRGMASKDTLRHATVSQTGVQQHNSYTTDVGRFELNFMHLGAERQLPPTVFEASSQKAQQDGITYANAGWQYHTAKNGWNANLGWIREKINYQDSLLGLNAANKANSFVFQPEYSRSIKGKHLLKISGYHRTDLADLDAVSERVQRQESALIVSLAMAFSGRWLINANVRGGYSRQMWQPVIPSVATSYAIKDYLTAKLQLARHYREPTLNDLYWEPGGNPDLQPENGSSADATLLIKPKWKKGKFSAALTGYITYIQDQIVWEPQGSIWSPGNVSEVFTRGAEAWMRVVWPVGQWRLAWKSGVSYTRASKDAFTSPHQVAQVPIWKSNYRLALHWRHFKLQYRHQVTGRRFTNAGNSAWLPAYNVGTLELSGGYGWGDLGLKAFVKADNIWNQNYRIVAAYFMPPRHYKIGLSIFFHKK